MAKEKFTNLRKANKKASYRVIAGERNMAGIYAFAIFGSLIVYIFFTD